VRPRNVFDLAETSDSALAENHVQRPSRDVRWSGPRLCRTPRPAVTGRRGLMLCPGLACRLNAICTQTAEPFCNDKNIKMCWPRNVAIVKCQRFSKIDPAGSEPQRVSSQEASTVSSSGQSRLGHELNNRCEVKHPVRYCRGLLSSSANRSLKSKCGVSHVRARSNLSIRYASSTAILGHRVDWAASSVTAWVTRSSWVGSSM
jgi:hypothetical protein